MELSSPVALQIALLAVLMIGFTAVVFYFLANPERAKHGLKGISSIVTIVVMIIGFVAFSATYLLEKRNTFFARLSCEVERKYAPTKVSCFNFTQDADEVTWLVNGEPRDGTSETLTFNVTQAGNYQVELLATQHTFFTTNSAQSGELVIVGERQAFEREVTSKHFLSFQESGVRTFNLRAPGGFIVDEGTVIVKLDRHRGDLRIVNQQVTEQALTVTVQGISKVDVDVFSIRREPSEGTLIMGFTAKRP